LARRKARAAPPTRFWDGFQWVENVDANLLARQAAPLIQATRKDRRLYVGNLPQSMGLTEKQISEFLSAAMRQRGMISVEAEDPILSVWMAPDGQYCFVEFHTIEIAAQALGLSGTVLLNQALRISRPNNWIPTPELYPPGAAYATHTGMSIAGPAGSTASADAAAERAQSLARIGVPMATTAAIAMAGVPMATPAALPMPPSLLNPMLAAAQAAAQKAVAGLATAAGLASAADAHHGALSTDLSYMGMGREPSANLPPAAAVAAVAPPSEIASEIVRCSNMLTPAELADSHERLEIKEDVLEECRNYGTVLAIKVPVSNNPSCDIYVQFEQPSAAAAAVVALRGRKFDGRVVGMELCTAAAFEAIIDGE